VAGALMSSFQAITLWYPRERWPLFNSIIMTVGGLGAAAGTGPVEAALKFTDWRGVFLGLGLATIAVAAVIFFVVPERKRDARPETLGTVIKGVATVFRHPVLLAIGPVVFFCQCANLAILTLWGGLWLRDVGGLDRADSALVLGLANLGLTAGFILNAFAGEFAARRKIPLQNVTFVLTALFLVAQIFIVFRIDAGAAWPWIAFGLFANAVIFVYPLLAGHLPVAFSGRASTSANFLSFTGAFLGQYLIGWVMDAFPRQANGGYAGAAYDWAFGGILALEFLGLLWFFYAYGRIRPPAAS